jgi:hypothetical protein
MPASCFILFLNSISNLCPSLDSQSWHNSSCSWLYHSIPSLFQGIFFCPRFVYFALAGLTLLGMVLSPCFIHSMSFLPWFLIVLQKQQPKSILSDWQ